MINVIKLSHLHDEMIDITSLLVVIGHVRRRDIVWLFFNTFFSLSFAKSILLFSLECDKLKLQLSHIVWAAA